MRLGGAEGTVGREMKRRARRGGSWARNGRFDWGLPPAGSEPPVVWFGRSQQRRVEIELSGSRSRQLHNAHPSSIASVSISDCCLREKRHTMVSGLRSTTSAVVHVYAS